MVNKNLIWSKPGVKWIISILGAALLFGIIDYLGKKVLGDFPIFILTLIILIIIVIALYIYDEYKFRGRVEENLKYIKNKVSKK